MKLRIRGTQRPVTIQENRRLGSGGEATVYTVPEFPHAALKLFHSHLHRDWNTLEAKLTLMRSSPPADPTQSLQHASIAWPTELVEDNAGVFRGYVMPLVASARGAFEYFNPKSRRSVDPKADYRFLVRVAQNLAASMQAIHNSGYVIGDVNEQNVLVSRNALITIIDTDSFQIPAANGTYFHCTVGKTLYLPAELHGQPLHATVRSRQHDLFGLAVLIYQLLMEGTHPYSGIDLGPDMLTIEDRIRLDRLPSQGSQQVQPSPLAPPFRMLPLTLRQLLVRSFASSQQRSAGECRPEAHTWAKCLADYSDSLISCSSAPTRHYYGKHLSDCPWCQRRNQFGGFDTFGDTVIPPESPLPPPSPPAPSVLKCPFCAVKYESKKTLAKHLRDKHTIITLPLTCRLCPEPKTFLTRETFASHLHAKHGQQSTADVVRQLVVQKPFPCSNCSKAFETQVGLEHHRRDKHSPTSQPTTAASKAPKNQTAAPRTAATAPSATAPQPSTGCCVVIAAWLILSGLSGLTHVLWALELDDAASAIWLSDESPMAEPLPARLEKTSMSSNSL